jgi:peptide/nickel transport system ATP-binding protein
MTTVGTSDRATSTTGTKLLEVKHISVDYYAANGAVHALSDINISLDRGQVLGLAGESGSGKSTLAYAITRLLRPPAVITEGQVLYYPRSRDEQEHTKKTKRNTSSNLAGDAGPVDILQFSSSELRVFRWSELAIVFQSAMNALNPVLNIGTQMMDVLHTHRPEMSRAALQQRAEELLRMVGIASDRIRSYPHELSGGMRQRAMIAISLALSPELIIMDEPTTALDVVVQREILTEIMGLSKRLNFSVIFITHDLSLLLEIADKIAIMYAGRIVEEASCHELQRQPLHPYSYGLLNSFPTIHGPRRKMTGIPGSPPDLRVIPTGCSFHPRCPMAFDACQEIFPQLAPPTPQTLGQTVACHLYNTQLYQGALPDNRLFAERYKEHYERQRGPIEVLDAAQEGEQTHDSMGENGNGSTRVEPELIAADGEHAAITPVLEAHNLRKYFPLQQFRLFGPAREVHAVEDTSLVLYPGHALAVVGESGSGKTTVARLLARLYDTTAGTMTFRGRPANSEREMSSQEFRRHVQLVFQDPFASLNPVHSVRYHLSRPLRIYGHAHTTAQETEQILALLERVSLSPAEQFIEKFPHQLSGGQRQRVAIARALAARPEVLLADEPVSMLDVSIRLDILNLLLRLKNEEHLALLFITHDIASARYFAEDTLVMYAGQAVEGGPSDKVIQHPRHPYTQLLISAAPEPNALEVEGQEKPSIPARGEIPSLITPPSGCRFHTRCPHAMPVCSQRFPERTDLGEGHWTHCFLYGESENISSQ